MALNNPSFKIIILAGGRGERFWPLSTPNKPKQLLPLITGKSMIKESIIRASLLASLNDIFVATNIIQYKALKKELPEIPISNIIIEPAFKDTASAIGYVSTIITRRFNEDSIIVVLASDHLISDLNQFKKSIKLAVQKASKGFIVTLGIKPSKPEVGYGYIKLDSLKIGKVCNTHAFLEKPKLEQAKNYIKEGNYVWNSGMFIYKYSTLMNEMNKYLPKNFEILKRISTIINNKYGLKLSKFVKPYFDELERISIDYAIMEKSKIIKCIPVDFGWNDVGSFLSLEEIFGYDNNNNVLKNVKFINIDSNFNIVISDEKSKLIASIGISNMIIVSTKNAILITPKSEIHRIKDLLQKVYSLS